MKECFPAIRFNRGLSVILARVKHRADRDKDSHNLGKSLLIELLEFMLLKGTSPQLFLIRHYDRFKEFEFYLELGLHDATFLTIKRTVAESSKISFCLSPSSIQLNSGDLDLNWQHTDVPFEKSIDLLDSYLDLTAIKPWSFRKGVSYFLRRQHDYLDPFQISKYTSSHHEEWKPYLARILGLNDELLIEKYKIDKSLGERKDERKELQSQLVRREEEYDSIKGTIEIKRDELDKKADALDKFDFHQRELEINESLARDIEARTAEINNELYNLNYDRRKIQTSLAVRLKFNLKEIKEIYEEAKVNFSSELQREYEDLVAFNRKITRERNRHLKARDEELEILQRRLEDEHKSLSMQRKEIFEILQRKETLRKFKDLQKTLDKDRADLTLLETQLKKLDAVIDLSKEVRKFSRQRDGLKDQISAMVKEGSPKYKKVRRIFNEIIMEVLNANALLAIQINKEGNLDFLAEFLRNQETEDVTSEHQGSTYLKMLCMAFDLAVLQGNEDENFFKFIYHDGAFEGLDNRKKLGLLEVIRRITCDHKVQYILTTIEDDLPRDDKDKMIEFTAEEVIRELHDGGDDGRLFRMSKF